VEEAPVQIDAGEASAVTSGNGLTVTVMEAVFEHPMELVPVTVYVVVVSGLTVMLADVAPVFHR
jgi:hypothetical protein